MKTIIMALVLTACTTTAPDMPRLEACEEQANAWCDIVAPDAPGCWVVYRQWCGMEGAVQAGDQATCLDAVAAMRKSWDGSYPVPDACRRTWAVP